MEKRRNAIYGYDEKDNTENNENLLKLKNLKESCQSNVLKDFIDDYLISGFKNEFIDVDMIIKEIDNHSKNQDLIKIIYIVHLIFEQMNVNSNEFPIDELCDYKYESVNGELFIKFLTRESENQFSKMYEIVLFNNHKDEKIGEKIIKSFENKGSIMVMNILSLLNMQIIGKKQQKENKEEKFDTVGALYSSDAFMDSYDWTKRDWG
ncbi:hypothetical protein [Methanobrevibacter smithii]|uniref:hypothetical protein n=1 Tax=Methanobrevibacter smithii TaxID=2173 RepID=UPI0003694B51|nr:hypothetical protein [Methanobrevibacter smithii]